MSTLTHKALTGKQPIVRVDDSTAEMVRRLAREEERTVTAIISRAVALYEKCGNREVLSLVEGGRRDAGLRQELKRRQAPDYPRGLED